jgi:hypothetical protein
MENMKEGLTEKSAMGDVEKKMGMKRDNPGQVPNKPAVEKASKGGKSFKIQ